MIDWLLRLLGIGPAKAPEPRRPRGAEGGLFGAFEHDDEVSEHSEYEEEDEWEWDEDDEEEDEDEWDD